MNLQMRRVAILPLCFLLATGLTLGSFGDVLCIGDDGHIKVESVCQPCCGEADDFYFLTVSDSGQNHHHECVNCLDLSLDRPTWLRKDSRPAFCTIHNTSPSSLSLISCFDNTNSNYSLSSVTDCFPGRGHSAVLISTTVLIC